MVQLENKLLKSNSGCDCRLLSCDVSDSLRGCEGVEEGS
jgi:hypothetical protein